MRGILVAAIVSLLCIGSAFAEEDTAKKLDASTERVADCSISEMTKADGGMLLISWSEMSKLCEMAQTSIGHMPEIGVLRYLIKASYLIHRDTGADQKETAYQLLNIVEARASETPEKMKSTFNLAYGVNHLTSGHVSPRDLNIFLRSSGEMAHTLSDGALARMAAVLWEDKKKNGD